MMPQKSNVSSLHFIIQAPKTVKINFFCITTFSNWPVDKSGRLEGNVLLKRPL